ncbi:MAG TPA: beta-N-acetylhexosaminidase [Saprospiraceae bacterium]|nr:beta-N-acetylhexosaminidase [Saprospiraceae bacterium]
MKKNIFLVFVISFILICQDYAQQPIIPVPVSYVLSHEIFALENNITVLNETRNPLIDKYIQDFYHNVGMFGLTPTAQADFEKVVRIKLNVSPFGKIGKEGYQIAIHEKEILVTANEPAGIFYAFQTLKQLMAAPREDGLIKISGGTILDYPRFKWRGLMLDVSRHFFTVDEVKAYINQMATYKFNVFHWHLTDDHGWRIEIKSLPKLTEIGAWRVKRYGFFGGPDPKPNEKATDGGFYTQEQIRDVIQYAADRNITIVPEIDMPGHSMAALAAYPEFSTKKEPKFVNPGTRFSEWYGNGKFKMLIENMLNPADEKTYEFVDKIFTEVAELFPGEYIHAGGDECYHGYWEADPQVQKFMSLNNIKNTDELQNYFVNRVAKIISSKGKKMIGWDEILAEGLSDDAAIMSWRGMKGGMKAVRQKRQVVMSPTTYAYLDYTQGDKSVENSVYASLSLEKVYEFNPAPDSIDSEYVMGGQGNLWTEKVATLPFAFYMTYPRAFALSESLWSPLENKKWNNFIRRVEYHFRLFDQANTNICKAVYEPIIRVYKEDDSLMCALKCAIPNAEIFYTIDNTYPPKFGHKYKNPFLIPEGNLKLRTQSYRDGQALGREIIVDREVLVERVKKKR